MASVSSAVCRTFSTTFFHSVIILSVVFPFADLENTHWTILTCIAISASAIWYWCQREYVRVRRSGELEKAHCPGSRSILGMEDREKGRIGPIPAPYPNAWYRACGIRELPVDRVRYIRMAGRHIAIFRGSDGKPRGLDAYCPHLGANLAFGGVVENSNCLRCPFHGWKFDGDDGRCVEIPYSKETHSSSGSEESYRPCKDIPSSANTRAYRVHETNGGVYVWIDCEDREPQYLLQPTKQIDSREWVYHGRAEHIVHAHVQDLPENGVDIAHLQYLHLPSAVCVDWTKVPLLSSIARHVEHRFDVQWKPYTDPGSRHLVHIPMHEEFYVFGVKLGLLSMDVVVTQIGPTTVRIDFQLPIGRLMIWESITTLKPLEQKVVHEIWTSWHIPRVVAKIIMQTTILQFERDVPIWDNKTYLRQPTLVRGDGNIAQFRRWFSQFYTEKSISAHEGCGIDW